MALPIIKNLVTESDFEKTLYFIYGHLNLTQTPEMNTYEFINGYWYDFRQQWIERFPNHYEENQDKISCLERCLYAFA